MAIKRVLVWGRMAVGPTFSASACWRVGEKPFMVSLPCGNTKVVKIQTSVGQQSRTAAQIPAFHPQRIQTAPCTAVGLGRMSCPRVVDRSRGHGGLQPLACCPSAFFWGHSRGGCKWQPPAIGWVLPALRMAVVFAL